MTATPFAGIKVLVVDACQDVREHAKSALAQAGCDVLLAADGFEALSGVTDGEPAVVFADTALPRLNGYQMCALIKRHRHYSGTAVVLWSVSDTVFERARARSAGSDALLAKPCAPDTLLEMLAALSEPRREAEALA
jgi:twitching motility two-component system response regulator PilG